MLCKRWKIGCTNGPGPIANWVRNLADMFMNTQPRIQCKLLSRLGLGSGLGLNFGFGFGRKTVREVKLHHDD